MEFLRMHEIAATLGVSERKLTQMIALGQFPRARKVCGKSVWTLTDLKAYLHLCDRMTVTESEKPKEDSQPKTLKEQEETTWKNPEPLQ